jgi:glycosyltransferase involved in cell wall biosynthesis
MRIAYIGIKGLPAKGGAERVIEAIIKILKRRHEISVYCSKRYTPGNSLIDGIKLIRIPGLSGKHTHMTSIDLLAALHAVFYGAFDLIHLHHIEASFILPVLKLKYPIVSTAHGRITYDNKWGSLSTKIMRSMELPFGIFSKIATSVSLPDSTQLSKKLGRNVLYVPNGVDTNAKPDTTTAQVILKTRALPLNKYILFATDRIIPLKGVHLLLEAYKLLQEKTPLVIIGNMDYTTEYARKVKSMADDRVTFLPFQSSKNTLFGLIKLCRVFVFPSTNEAMSMMLLEAASLGAPIISSRIPANTAILNMHALYFFPNDINDFANKLKWALSNPLEMQALGNRAKIWVNEKFSWNEIAEKYEELYTSALSSYRERLR